MLGSERSSLPVQPVLLVGFWAEANKRRLRNHTQASSCHYSEVCVAFDVARIAALSNDSAAIVQLARRYMRVITDSIENTANHVDANVYGILPLELYRPRLSHTGNGAGRLYC